ncbi:S-layer homology domain-containing protein, partial [Paenibacillus sp. 598K]|uniref:S-layer homology domain-containing protein n=1 Tax=Paenibacillus sp. 598K TaxID=1117987 RepID=UPI0016288C13
MKKWTAAGLAAAMLCGSLGPVAHGQPLAMAQMPASAMVAQQADNQAGTVGASKHWADAALSKWKEAGVFSGYEDGTLQPDRLISRAELATLLQRILGLSRDSSTASGAVEFTDVAATAWYYGAVMEAREAGIIEGYEDGTFRPEQTVSREDAAVMLARAFQLAGLGADGSEGSSAKFTDAGQLKPYAREVVDLLAAWGVLSGYEDGSFRPERGISRGEAATILNRVGGELYHQEGTYDTAETLAHAVINTRDVVLRNKTVTGNLFLAQGIGDGDITVEQSKVAGNLLALGSEQGVRLIDSTVERLVLHRSATVELSETTQVEELVLGGRASAIVIEGKGKIARIWATDSRITVNGQVLQPGEEWTWSGNGKLEKTAAGGTTEGEEGTENQGSTGGNGGTGGAGGSWSGGGAAPGSGGTDHGQSGVWLPAATPGVIPGTVKVSAPVAEGHELAVRIGHRPIAEPTVGAVFQKDSLTVYPYRAGDDISGVDSEVNKYLGIYEVDSQGNIVRFRSVTLTASAIRPETWRAVWQDEFDSANIDASKWNFVQGANGYGNNELQNYTNRSENARVEDGKLVIEAREDNYEGTRYSSAKLTTEGKGAWTYGKYEIRAKMPSGQGIWPALWMMPSDSKLYSAWPASGEIDIMELLGHEPGKLYGTLHFGTPHQQSQGTYTLPDNGSFADDYHIYGIEWEPGEVRYYVDGILYYKANDWFSKSNQEGGKYTYPAPFDRDFFLQFNVAVGGDWPGDPDASTVFPQQMRIEYVRVYEREGGVYREPTLPAEPVVREPAADGNYIVNGAFDDSTASWAFQPFAPPEDLFGGVGSVSVDQGAVKTTIEQEGRETYAVQLVQSEVPIAKDATYQLSFDAWSTGERTMDVAISGPDRNYVRYMKDRTVDLTSQPQNFQFTFTSDVDTDPNARLEFNMGKAGTAPVWIDQVKLIKLAGPDESHQQAPLPDGNLIYNGSFDQGTDRMGFWSIGGAASATAQA